MYYHIITNCGKTITRKTKRLNAARQRNIRHAMVGAAIKDKDGNLLDVKDVAFSKTKTPPISQAV